MNNSPDWQSWAFAAITIVLAVVLPILIEYGVAVARVAKNILW